MKLLYGTTNQGKLNSMKKMLKGLDIEILGLNDIDVKVEDIDESGNNPLENARIKAMAYYKAIKLPVFSCDSGLFIEGLNDREQPGVHVRRVNGKELNDEEMIEYYSNLALKHGGKVKARYKNAICLVIDEDIIYEYDRDNISQEFLITSEVHPKRIKGFPLDSLSVDIKTGEYNFDLQYDGNNEDFENLAKGIRYFFIMILEFIKKKKIL